MSETIITVHGEFAIHHPAERGTVRLSVGFEGAQRTEVLSRTTQAHEQLSAQLRELHNPAAGPVTWWSADQVRVWGQRPWNQDGTQLPIVHHGTTEFTAKFSDLQRLGEFIGEVSERDGISVGGIEWNLTGATRQTLTRDARRHAVANAVAKATDFATSLGLSALLPVALSDPGMLGDGSAASGQPLQAMAFARAPGAESAVVLKPENITIDVQVHARFSAS